MERALLHAILITKNGTFWGEISNNNIEGQKKKMYLYVYIYIYNNTLKNNTLKNFYCPLLLIFF